MNTKQISVSLIDCNDWNPNEMSVKMRQILTDNLSRIGMVDPILVAIDKDRYRIVDGEHRYRIAVELGYEEVPCVILNEEVPLTN